MLLYKYVYFKDFIELLKVIILGQYLKKLILNP